MYASGTDAILQLEFVDVVVESWYSEKDQLATANPGFFAFGVNVKTGYYWLNGPPTNGYDYYQDTQEFRFKHVDEHLGLVDKYASNTYGYYGYNDFYYYDYYYTYQAHLNKWTD